MTIKVYLEDSLVQTLTKSLDDLVGAGEGHDFVIPVQNTGTVVVATVTDVDTGGDSNYSWRWVTMDIRADLSAGYGWSYEIVQYYFDGKMTNEYTHDIHRVGVSSHKTYSIWEDEVIRSDGDISTTSYVVEVHINRVFRGRLKFYANGGIFQSNGQDTKLISVPAGVWIGADEKPVRAGYQFICWEEVDSCRDWEFDSNGFQVFTQKVCHELYPDTSPEIEVYDVANVPDEFYQNRKLDNNSLGGMRQCYACFEKYWIYDINMEYPCVKAVWRRLTHLPVRSRSDPNKKIVRSTARGNKVVRDD